MIRTTIEKIISYADVKYDYHKLENNISHMEFMSKVIDRHNSRYNLIIHAKTRENHFHNDYNINKSFQNNMIWYIDRLCEQLIKK